MKCCQLLAVTTILLAGAFVAAPVTFAQDATKRPAAEPPEKPSAPAASENGEQTENATLLADLCFEEPSYGEQVSSTITAYPALPACPPDQPASKHASEVPTWLLPLCDECKSWSQFNLNGPPVDSTYVQGGIQWKHVLVQSLTFTTTMNLFRIATEPSTRKDLKGPFWKDYFKSATSVRGWRDGDEFLVNYIGHPLEGAVAGNILINNDPNSSQLSFGRDRRYWLSRLKAFGWAAAVSTQFEIGPFGEASIGNVGLKPSDKSRHPAAYVDLVVTPVVGTAWLIGEDMLDRFVIRKIEGHTKNRFVRLMVRSFLNPGRSFANTMRGEWWWHRNDRSLKDGVRGFTG